MFTRKKNLGDRLKDLFGVGQASDSQFEELEDALLEADIGAKLTVALVESLRVDVKQNNLSGDAIRRHLAAMMEPMLKKADLTIDPLALNCFLFLGVNGVGKTTSIAKLAHRISRDIPKEQIVFAAGDTFRAAASEQLVLHGSRLGIRTVSQGSGADAAAVIFDALESARARKDCLVLADTAGRLHNKTHLVRELEKIDKIARGKSDVYRKILVLDATTGRNGLQQAEVFHQAIGIDALILSKFDSSAKGGMMLSVCRDLGIGIAYVGTGESLDALEVFEPARFARTLLGLQD